MSQQRSRGLSPQQQAAARELEERRLARIKGYGEAGLAIGSGLAGSVAGGASGLFALGSGMGLDAAAQTVRSTQDRMYIPPKSEEGQQALDTIGQFAQTATEYANLIPAGYEGLQELIQGNGIDAAAQAISDVKEQGYSQYIGDEVLESTGSPALATAAYMAPIAAVEALGFKGANMMGRRGMLGKEYELSGIGGQANRQRGAISGIDDPSAPKPDAPESTNLPAETRGRNLFSDQPETNVRPTGTTAPTEMQSQLQSLQQDMAPQELPQGALGDQNAIAQAENAANQPEAGTIPDGGGVRGSDGIRQISPQTNNSRGTFEREPDGSLQGLPRIRDAAVNPVAQSVAESYAQRRGIDYKPPATYVKVNPQRASRIAEEFDRMEHNPQDPKVIAAYDAMIEETLDQYQEILDSGLKVEFIDFEKTGDPYADTPRLANEDIKNNNHMYVFSTKDGFGSDVEFDPTDNPLLRETEFTDANGQPMLANDVFRVVHDYFGHAKEGVGFRADGEENAWRAHAAMYSPLARQAMTTETRGQNSWVNYGKFGEKNRTAKAEDTVFADQKIGLLPEWVMEQGRDDIPEWQERMLTQEKFDELQLGGRSFGTTRSDPTSTSNEGMPSLGSATFDNPVPLQGGIGFSDQYGMGWAARDERGTGKLIKDDFLVTTAMAQDAHQSNATVSTIYTQALEKNIADGFVSKDTIKQFEAELSKKFPDIPRGGDPKKFNDWLDNATFLQRAQVMTTLAKATYENKGLPDVRRLLNQTRDPAVAGAYPQEGLTLIMNDPNSGIVPLDGVNYPTHLSYKFGTKGEIVAVLPPNMTEWDLHPAKWTEYIEDFTAKGNKTPWADAAYTFGYGVYGSEFGASQRDLLPKRENLKGTRPITTKAVDAALSTLQDDWTVLQKGGSLEGTKAFIRSMNTNDGGATLTPMRKTDVDKMVKEGDAKIYQLGTGDKGQDIKFMIKKGGYNWADKSLPKEEWVLSSVINNEKGVQGIAAEAILHKAIQEGVTALDAFDVGTFSLPKIYGKYGFEEAARVPFKMSEFKDPVIKYYIAENTPKGKKPTAKTRREAKTFADQRLKDAENFWRSQGWDESQGYPDMVIMRQEKDSERIEAIRELYSDGLDQFRNETGSVVVGGITSKAPSEQYREFIEVLRGAQPDKEAWQQKISGSSSRADSVLPDGRRSSVIDTINSAMAYPTQVRRFNQPEE